MFKTVALESFQYDKTCSTSQRNNQYYTARTIHLVERTVLYLSSITFEEARGFLLHYGVVHPPIIISTQLPNLYT
jgi:hypothetical protein